MCDSNPQKRTKIMSGFAEFVAGEKGRAIFAPKTASGQPVSAAAQAAARRAAVSPAAGGLGNPGGSTVLGG